MTQGRSDLDGTVLEGRIVRLRAVEPSDYQRLRQIELSASVAQTYRFRGKTPSPEAYAASLWNDTTVNLAICVPPKGEVVGNLACYAASFRDQHAHVSMVIAPWARSPLTFEAVELFFTFLFDTFDFRKIYADVLAPNLEQFASAVGYVAREEARFVEDVKIGGEWHDRIVLAIWQDAYRARLTQDGRRGSTLADALIAASNGHGSSDEGLEGP